jgi:hypothetical protein
MMIERALALDPNLAWAWNRSGWLRNYHPDQRHRKELDPVAIRVSRHSDIRESHTNRIAPNAPRMH